MLRRRFELADQRVGYVNLLGRGVLFEFCFVPLRNEHGHARLFLDGGQPILDFLENIVDRGNAEHLAMNLPLPFLHRLLEVLELLMIALLFGGLGLLERPL